jgi:hypothetical protein
MKHLFWIPFAAALVTLGVAQSSKNPFLGRWDVTVTAPNGTTYPDWIEVTQKDGKLAGLIQPQGGGAVLASGIHVEGNKLYVTLGGHPPLPPGMAGTTSAENAASKQPPAGAAAGGRKGGRGAPTTWELTASNGGFSGVAKRGDSVLGNLAGVRAPALNRKMPKSWADPEPIFNGKDLAGWEPFGRGTNHWVAKDGELVDEDHGANLKSTRKFDDFKLHVEFNCPNDGNSGIYLRGRYEVQIEYEDVDASDPFHSIGSIYSFVPPKVALPRTPGTWESFDITLVGRRLTIIRNGTKTIDNQEIPGPTGGALDSNEAEPGPFYLQGDHTGNMRFRNMTVQVPKA